MSKIDVTYTLEKLESYKNSNNEKQNKMITSIIETLNSGNRYITNLQLVEDVVKECENSNHDEILYKMYFELTKYNEYIADKKIKQTTPILDKDIDFDSIEIKLTDILSYLDISKESVDPLLYDDIKNYANLESLKEFSTYIKTSNDVVRTIYDKIEDKNVLLSILLHSSKDLVNNIIKIFKDNKSNINKVVSNIPTIFIKNKLNDKCKYEVITNYDLFMSNYNLLNEYGINFKTMLKWPAFFVNDTLKNKDNIEKLISLDIKPANVLEYAGGVFTMNPEIIFNNIEVLRFHGIEFTDDNNNNGYTILGISNLDDRINYLIEKEMWENE